MSKLQDSQYRICGNCFFFYFDGDSDDDGESFGRCLRFPPVYIGLQPGESPNNEPFKWKQPAVYPSIDTCGEWKQN